jgi:uncharacterized protein YecE (DUF72 family)
LPRRDDPVLVPSVSDDDFDRPPTPDEVADLAARLPAMIRFGTSSWTYPAWEGLIYSRRFPATGAGAAMLAEYARWPLMRTVGIDSFFYAPPSPRLLDAYAAALPAGFPCVSKVWERITTHTFTSPRERQHRGEENPDWLNADLFVRDVLTPLREHFGDHTGPLVFEFTPITKRSGMTADAFAGRLDRFFAALPTDFHYATEIRNAEFLGPEYFAVLRNHHVAHVFNSWTRMPSIGEQLLLHDAVTADFIVARALLRPGRSYAKAVEAFAPYDRVKERSPELRRDLVALVETAIQLRLMAYVVVNNRAEGCAPLTIAAVVRRLLAGE